MLYMSDIYIRTSDIYRKSTSLKFYYENCWLVQYLQAHQYSRYRSRWQYDEGNFSILYTYKIVINWVHILVHTRMYAMQAIKATALWWNMNANTKLYIRYRKSIKKHDTHILRLS